MENIRQIPGDHEPVDLPKGVAKLRARWTEVDSMAGVGLDPDIDRIPDEIWDAVGGRQNIADGFSLFNQTVVDATAPHVVDFKVNSNFYQGAQGREALQRTFDYLKENHPNVLRVCDGKFADIGNTAEKIAEEIFGQLDADAVLLNPYMGFDAIEPFTRWKDKLIILCINTSNPSASAIQDLRLEGGELLWQNILRTSMEEWNINGNIIPVLSATHPENLEGVRDIVGDTPILLAGIGAQGGELSTSIPHCMDSSGYGMMISSSRGILYPERQPDESIGEASLRAVLDLKGKINQAKQDYLSAR